MVKLGIYNKTKSVNLKKGKGEKLEGSVKLKEKENKFNIIKHVKII